MSIFKVDSVVTSIHGVGKVSRKASHTLYPIEEDSKRLVEKEN